jgi:hypothetical protein
MIVSLYDMTGIMVRDWAEAGHECYCYDLLNTDRSEPYGTGIIHYRKADLREPHDELNSLRPQFMASFPPCTDLAVSGARHFKRKAKEDNFVFQKALQLVAIAVEYGNRFACPWFVENPVSLLNTLWKPPDHIFHPYEFGGYLPEEEYHPLYRGYVAPRDAYPKKTCLWVGGGFIMPLKKPIEPERGWNRQTLFLGGTGEKTKEIRSATPRGFARAIFEMYGAR